MYYTIGRILQIQNITCLAEIVQYLSAFPFKTLLYISQKYCDIFSGSCHKRSTCRTYSYMRCVSLKAMICASLSPKRHMTLCQQAGSCLHSHALCRVDVGRLRATANHGSGCWGQQTSSHSKWVSRRTKNKLCTEKTRMPHLPYNRFTGGGEIGSLTRRSRFTPGEDSWFSFLLVAESTTGPYWSWKG